MRIFFALHLAQQTQQEIQAVINSLQKHVQENAIRWTKPQNLHITLQFLADLKEDDLPELITLAQNEAQKSAAFSLQLLTPELFPSSAQPRFISLTPEPRETLKNLSQQLAKVLAGLNYVPEKREFRGHLTLGKFLHQARTLDLKNITLPAVKACQINEIILFASKPSPDGSHYTQLARLPLSH